jgi:predicted transcriptional regulator
MKNRSRTEIMSLILTSAYDDQVITTRKLMYKVHLSYSVLKEYLIILDEAGLIARSEEERCYRTTQKGVHFLQVYNQMSDMILFPLQSKWSTLRTTAN